MPYQNPYMPQFGYQPQGYMTPAQQVQQPVHGFVYVTGIEGAKAYQMPPNSEMPLFDSTNDGVMFIKQTDGAGYPTITVVDCKRRGEDASQAITRDELTRIYNDLASQIEDLKGAVNGLVPATAAPAKHGPVIPADGEGEPARRVQPAHAV